MTHEVFPFSRFPYGGFSFEKASASCEFGRFEDESSPAERCYSDFSGTVLKKTTFFG